MEFQTLIQKRFACRRYADRPVEQEKLKAVLEAGRMAPTGYNGQPQRILVIQSPEGLAKVRSTMRNTYQAPVVMVMCYDKEENPKELPTYREDAAIVMTHMLLAAYDLGLADVWMRVADFDQIRTLFEIPQRYEILGLLLLGYPHEDARPSRLHTTRRPLTETVFYETF